MATNQPRLVERRLGTALTGSGTALPLLERLAGARWLFWSLASIAGVAWLWQQARLGKCHTDDFLRSVPETTRNAIAHPSHRIYPIVTLSQRQCPSGRNPHSQWLSPTTIFGARENGRGGWRRSLPLFRVALSSGKIQPRAV